jgi:hypothetical protein
VEPSGVKTTWSPKGSFARSVPLLENNQILPAPTAIAEPSEETVNPPISLPVDEYVHIGSEACTEVTVEKSNIRRRNTDKGEVFFKYMHIASESLCFSYLKV